jgi:hypothetical protein
MINFCLTYYKTPPSPKSWKMRKLLLLLLTYMLCIIELRTNTITSIFLVLFLFQNLTTSHDYFLFNIL